MVFSSLNCFARGSKDTPREAEALLPLHYIHRKFNTKEVFLHPKRETTYSLLLTLTKDHVNHLDVVRHTSNTTQDPSLPGAGKGWQ